MGIGKNYAIFQQILDEKYTEQEKLQAIKAVIEMPTHNGITKGQILNALIWLFSVTIAEESEAQPDAN